MTAARLKELSKKFKDKSGDINDLGEILTELFDSNSKHLKELKVKLKEIEETQGAIIEEMDEIIKSQSPIFSIITEEED